MADDDTPRPTEGPAPIAFDGGGDVPDELTEHYARELQRFSRDRASNKFARRTVESVALSWCRPSSVSLSVVLADHWQSTRVTRTFEEAVRWGYLEGWRPARAGSSFYTKLAELCDPPPTDAAPPSRKERTWGTPRKRRFWRS
jgi:hypothetical protein